MKDCFLESNIILPQKVDLEKWSVVACDQFTSEKKYWQDLEEYVGDSYSTLNLIYPEIYLNDQPEKRVEKINSNMKRYIDNGVFRTLEKGFVLTVRKTRFVEKRVGLIGMLDLEEYDFNKGAKSLIRATENTIMERIPPRLKIRENAIMEFPHVMVLIDDEKREIIEQLYKNKEQLEKLYSFSLNMDGGAIEGYFVKDYEDIKKKLSNLLDSDRLKKKYGKNERLLFAVGDGNHSLATAKAHWDNVKKTLSKQEIEVHPARYALVEINNIYDEGIYFEPIHRFVSNVDVDKFISGLKNITCGNFKIYNGQTIEVVKSGDLPTTIKNVDEYITRYIKNNGGNVDYVHGEDNIKKLVDENVNCIGILFDKLDKKMLFKYVIDNGVLPKKTFSMGEGIEKRYYLEGRRIR